MILFFSKLKNWRQIKLRHIKNKNKKRIKIEPAAFLQLEQMEVNKKQNRNQIEILTCKKYAGNTHRWSSKREHCTRSSNSNKSLVATLSRSSFVVLVGERSNGALFNGWSDCTVAVVHAPIDWRLLEIGREKQIRILI